MEGNGQQGEHHAELVQERHQLDQRRQRQEANRRPCEVAGMRQRRLDDTSDETANTLYLPRAFGEAVPTKYVLGFYESARSFKHMLGECLLGSKDRSNRFLTVILFLSFLVTLIISLVKTSDETLISLAMILLAFLKLKFEHFMDGWSKLVSFLLLHSIFPNVRHSPVLSAVERSIGECEFHGFAEAHLLSKRLTNGHLQYTTNEHIRTARVLELLTIMPTVMLVAWIASAPMLYQSLHQWLPMSRTTYAIAAELIVDELFGAALFELCALCGFAYIASAVSPTRGHARYIERNRLRDRTDTLNLQLFLGTAFAVCFLPLLSKKNGLITYIIMISMLSQSIYPLSVLIMVVCLFFSFVAELFDIIYTPSQSIQLVQDLNLARRDAPAETIPDFQRERSTSWLMYTGLGLLAFMCLSILTALASIFAVRQIDSIVDAGLINPKFVGLIMLPIIGNILGVVEIIKAVKDGHQLPIERLVNSSRRELLVLIVPMLLTASSKHRFMPQLGFEWALALFGAFLVAMFTLRERERGTAMKTGMTLAILYLAVVAFSWSIVPPEHEKGHTKKGGELNDAERNTAALSTTALSTVSSGHS